MGDTSTAPAVKAPPDDGDLGITELVEFSPTRLDGVKAGATGFPFLIMKAAEPAEPAEVQPQGRPAWHPVAAALARSGARAPGVDPAVLFKAVNAAGEIDEAPDIDGGKQAIALIAKLIGYEAQELEAGCLDEVCDIGLLLEAASALKCWLSCEQEGAMITDGTDQMAGKAARDDWTEESVWTYLGDDVAKDSRTFTAAERKKHAANGTALPDGSYPIPDKDALRRAAILARSGHGDVKAARALIARRARELGVPNPLDTDDKATSSSAKGASVAEEVTAVDTEAIDQAVAKALASSDERFTALETELAKANAKIGEMAARPVHGGPVLSAAAHFNGAPKAGTDDWAAKAAYYRQQAEEVTDRQSADGYRQLAREADEKAKALTPG
jgi:hypothetical protein